jgi:hypothetical protein
MPRGRQRNLEIMQQAEEKAKYYYRMPGFFIKYSLIEEGPLNPSELHRRYKDKIKEANGEREKKHRIRGMTYHSFIRYLEIARDLDLVEKHHEEPLEDSKLLGIRDTKVVPASRVYYTITPKGIDEELAWGNLKRAAYLS